MQLTSKQILQMICQYEKEGFQPRQHQCDYCAAREDEE